MKNSNAILHDALELSQDERADIALRLIESLDDGADVDAEEVWAAELTRRLDSIQNGTAKIISVEEARRRVRRRLDGHDE